MARDAEIYEFAKHFPEGFFTLLGLEPAGPYTVESLAVKSQSRELDLVCVPAQEGDPRRYVEYQDWRDPEIERSFLLKIVNHCAETGERERVEAIMVYTLCEYRDCVLSADVGATGAPLIRFEPRRIVLEDIDPDEVLRRGGEALAALPLVGREKVEKPQAREWANALYRDQGGRPATELNRLVDCFGRFLLWRTDTITLEEAMAELEEIDVVRKLVAKRTAEAEARAQALGEERGAANLLASLIRERLVAHPVVEVLIERVLSAPPPVVQQASSLVLRFAEPAQLIAELDKILPPRSDPTG